MLDALLAPLVREVVYPRHGTRVPPDGSMHELVVDGTVLRGWVVNPGRDRVLLYFGGNGERLDLWQEVVARWFPGHTTYLMAYRGYGASDGRPSQPALTADAVALVDHVRGRHPGAPVDLIGRSLGSGVAMQVAAQRDVAHVVLVTPFDSLVATAADLVPHLPVATLIEDHWDSAALAPHLDVPVLVVRGGRDAVVRPERTDRLVEALAAPTVVSYPDADHEDISDDPGYWPAIVDFLDGSSPPGA
ncbi:alpha/beta hydrolase [Nocardioides zeicaulis]|uniref:Alpha/beta hydrolase n=1 Tax=Nocardioides zeicaulis TaxID=1776857 RepID=A0ABV6E5S2_9ACTN